MAWSSAVLRAQRRCRSTQAHTACSRRICSCGVTAGSRQHAQQASYPATVLTCAPSSSSGNPDHRGGNAFLSVPVFAMRQQQQLRCQAAREDTQQQRRQSVVQQTQHVSVAQCYLQVALVASVSQSQRQQQQRRCAQRSGANRTQDDSRGQHSTAAPQQQQGTLCTVVRDHDHPHQHTAPIC